MDGQALQLLPGENNIVAVHQQVVFPGRLGLAVGRRGDTAELSRLLLLPDPLLDNRAVSPLENPLQVFFLGVVGAFLLLESLRFLPASGIISAVGGGIGPLRFARTEPGPADFVARVRLRQSFALPREAEAGVHMHVVAHAVPGHDGSDAV